MARSVSRPQSLCGFSLRVRMFDCQSKWGVGIELLSLRCRDVCGEVGCAARDGVGAHAVDQVDRVVLQIVNAVAATLVGVRNRAPALESPFAAGSNCTIDPARSARCAGDNAWLGRIEVAGTCTINVTLDRPLPSSRRCTRCRLRWTSGGYTFGPYKCRNRQPL